MIEIPFTPVYDRQLVLHLLKQESDREWATCTDTWCPNCGRHSRNAQHQLADRLPHYRELIMQASPYWELGHRAPYAWIGGPPPAPPRLPSVDLHVIFPTRRLTDEEAATVLSLEDANEALFSALADPALAAAAESAVNDYTRQRLRRSDFYNTDFYNTNLGEPYEPAADDGTSV